TDEQREERRAAARQRYHELLGDASTHLSQERDRIQEIRGTWSDEQRAAQVEQDRLRRNVNQLSTSDEESTVYDIEEQPWLNKEGSGFMYNVAINYAAYGNIGALEEVCAHCQAREWKGEPNGMCCASEERGGQVVLPESLGRVVSTLDELIRCVYGDISRIPHQPNSWACERAILTPKNDQAQSMKAFSRKLRGMKWCTSP
ncbi:hypothetical protein HF086_013276, partial [Spodoptera exigua]